MILQQDSEWVSKQFLSAHQHILGYLVVDLDKEEGYNQGYLPIIKMNKKYTGKSKRANNYNKTWIRKIKVCGYNQGYLAG